MVYRSHRDMAICHSMPSLKTIVDFLDETLSIHDDWDFPGAKNGLQIENSGHVKRIAASVDACAATIEQAVAHHADLLVVHHGLFWSGAQPLVGGVYRKFKSALDANLAIYSAHLPLDKHPTLGNNALLARAIGLRKLSPFFEEKGQNLGVRSHVNISRTELAARLAKALGSPPILCPAGPDRVRRVGIVTGGAGAELVKAANEGVDTFITGEGPHWSYTAAEELGMNVFYGGHYLTETFGVKAVAELLSKKFRIPWNFIDHPTGL